jgi:hypothetical protein
MKLESVLCDPLTLRVRMALSKMDPALQQWITKWEFESYAETMLSLGISKVIDLAQMSETTLEGLGLRKIDRSRFFEKRDELLSDDDALDGMQQGNDVTSQLSSDFSSVDLASGERDILKGENLPLESLSISQMIKVLEHLEMVKYASEFEQMAIDGATIVSCTDDDFREVGIKFGPHRKKLLHKVEELKKGGVPESWLQEFMGPRDALRHASTSRVPNSMYSFSQGLPKTTFPRFHSLAFFYSIFTHNSSDP